MWLTGFDVPSLHTMYIDKPMKGHNLMQAIARVNRVFGDKPGGLAVDYPGIGNDLKKALSFYSESGGKSDPTNVIEKAIQLLKVEEIETENPGLKLKLQSSRSYTSFSLQTKSSISLMPREYENRRFPFSPKSSFWK